VQNPAPLGGLSNALTLVVGLPTRGSNVHIPRYSLCGSADLVLTETGAGFSCNGDIPIGGEVGSVLVNGEIAVRGGSGGQKAKLVSDSEITRTIPGI
jgi:hypothetical protein